MKLLSLENADSSKSRIYCGNVSVSPVQDGISDQNERESIANKPVV